MLKLYHKLKKFKPQLWFLQSWLFSSSPSHSVYNFSWLKLQLCECAWVHIWRVVTRPLFGSPFLTQVNIKNCPAALFLHCLLAYLQMCMVQKCPPNQSLCLWVFTFSWILFNISSLAYDVTISKIVRGIFNYWSIHSFHQNYLKQYQQKSWIRL